SLPRSGSWRPRSCFGRRSEDGRPCHSESSALSSRRHWPCHPEQSEGSWFLPVPSQTQIPRSARNDNRRPIGMTIRQLKVIGRLPPHRQQIAHSCDPALEFKLGAILVVN